MIELLPQQEHTMSTICFEDHYNNDMTDYVAKRKSEQEAIKDFLAQGLEPGQHWFFWCLKGAAISAYTGEPDGWEWPPRLSGRVAARNKQDARQKIAAEFGEEYPMRVLKKDQVKHPFLLYLEEMRADSSSARFALRFMPQQCKVCEREFVLNDTYNIIENHGRGGRHTCSAECELVLRARLRAELSPSVPGGHQPVIYCITHKPSGKKYIGKTDQAFTLRWYQHMYQPGNSEFHRYIKNSALTDWVFEVVECTNNTIPVEIQKDAKSYARAILAREQHWINHFDTINQGLNSAVSHKETMATPQQRLEFEMEQMDDERNDEHQHA